MSVVPESTNRREGMGVIQGVITAGNGKNSHRKKMKDMVLVSQHFFGLFLTFKFYASSVLSGLYQLIFFFIKHMKDCSPQKSINITKYNELLINTFLVFFHQ